MPNVFTPNEDNTNDFFNYVAPEGIGDDIIVTKFNIFNRWGKKVYSNETPNTGWDGEQGGKAAASDVYIYDIEISLEGCVLGRFKGDVTLLR